MRLAGICALSIAVLLPCQSEGQDGPRQPLELVRSLRSLQDQSAHGNVTAYVSQRTLLAQMAHDLAAADAAVWRDPRNVRAAIAFALSGGDPRAVKTVLSGAAIPGIDDRLMKGALAFGEGRNAEALDLLLPLDARALEPSIAGQIALAQSELVAKKDPGKALLFLDQARLLAPGTLVEEAALRRQIAIVASVGNFDRFESLSSLYLRRFPRSIYAGNFRQQFATEIATHHEYATDPTRLSKLGAALELLDPEHRLELSMMLAKEALIRGKLGMARFAAKIAVELSDANSAKGARARLYSAAVMILTDEYEQALAALKGIEREGLSREDVQLLDAAILVAAEVRQSPAASQSDGRLAQDLPKVAEVARSAIARVDRILSGAK